MPFPANTSEARPPRTLKEDKAIQLAQDILTFVAANKDKQPKYAASPTHPGGPPSEIPWKFAIAKFDAEISKDFHNKFDQRIASTVPRLEGTNTRTFPANRVIDDCHKAGNLVTIAICAGDILAMAV